MFVIVLPNQLIENNKLIKKNSRVYIYEHPKFFTKYKYHKIKIMLHRSAMKMYSDHIKKKYGCHIKYIEHDVDINTFYSFIKNKKADMYDPVDHDILKEIKKYSDKYNIDITCHDSPLFLTNNDTLNEYIELEKKNTTHNHKSFYVWQRKRLNILMTKDSNPLGGSWSFDTENRMPFPKNFTMKENIKYERNKYTEEAKKYVEKYFRNNVGTHYDLYFPIHYSEIKIFFKKFLKEKLKYFGKYQDAFNDDIIFGYHSILSPLINIGLISPQYIVDKTLEYYKKNKVHLSSVEGFIRQIIGWREYMRYIYLVEYNNLKKSNFFKSKNNFKSSWYTGNTGILPVDNSIKKALQYGYCHHIERLMVLSNFMLLCRIKPNDVYKWFMMMFIDSYEWVMIPNVYGMGQFSSGRLMTTRPYFSSSNYIIKMSNYKKKSGRKIKIGNKEFEWFDIWDTLYYYFIYKHRKFLLHSYAFKYSAEYWDKMSNTKKNDIKKNAGKILKYFVA